MDARNFNVDKDKKNLAWCFDGVPEENGVVLTLVVLSLKCQEMIFIIFTQSIY